MFSKFLTACFSKLSALLLLFHCTATGVDPFMPTSPVVVQKIYQTLKDLHDFCSLYNINYSIDAGTLLGAVRHRGLIPWDDVLALCIFEQDEQRLIELFPILEKAGYRIIKMAWGYKIYHDSGAPIPNRPFLFPGCDLFILKTDGKKAFYRIRFPAELHTNIEFDMQDIFPLRDYVFGPLVVPGPRNPFPYLTTWYGQNYFTVGRREFDHATDSPIKGAIKTLTEADYAPARPLFPLETRITPMATPQFYPYDSIPTTTEN